MARKIHDIVDKLSKTWGGSSLDQATQALETDKYKLAKQFLSIVFNAKDTSDLAQKLVDHKAYLDAGGNPGYIRGSQPKSQQHYYNANQPDSNPVRDRWKKAASMARQDIVKVTLRPKELEALHEVYETFSQKLQSDSGAQHILKNIIAPIQDDSTLSLPNQKDKTEVAQTLLQHWQGDIDNNQPLSKPQKVLFDQCDAFWNTLTFITTRYPKSKNPITLSLSRNEEALLSSVLNELPYYKSKPWATPKNTQSKQSIWTMSLHGRGKDSTLKLADSSLSQQVFPYQGKLYFLNPENMKAEKANTKDYKFKTIPGEAGLVITTDGTIHIFDHFEGREGDEGKAIQVHSLVTGGKPVLFAGSIKIKDGQIKRISKRTGHYHTEYTLDLLLFLQEKGLLTPNLEHFSEMPDAVSTQIPDAVAKDSFELTIQNGPLSSLVYNVLTKDPEGIARLIDQEGLKGFNKIIQIIKTTSLGKMSRQNLIKKLLQASYPKLISASDHTEDSLKTELEAILKSGESKPRDYHGLLDNALKELKEHKDHVIQSPSLSQKRQAKNLPNLSELSGIKTQLLHYKAYSDIYPFETIFKGHGMRELPLYYLKDIASFIEEANSRELSQIPDELMHPILTEISQSTELSISERFYLLDLLKHKGIPVESKMAQLGKQSYTDLAISKLPWQFRFITRLLHWLGFDVYTRLHGKKRIEILNPRSSQSVLPQKHTQNRSEAFKKPQKYLDNTPKSPKNGR